MNFSLFDDFPDGIVVTDKDFNVEYLNDSAVTTLRLSSKRQLLNNKIGSQFSELESHLAKGASNFFVFTEVSLTNLPSGRPLTLFFGAKKLEAHGKILIYARDVTVEISLFKKFKREKKEKEKALESSVTDALTQCLNKEGLYQEIEKVWQRIQKHGGIFAVFVIDLDDFKEVNDVHGHQVGDEYLADFAQLLKDTFRDRDIIGRFGGDEFVVVLRDCDSDEAGSIAERLIEDTQQYRFIKDEISLNVSLSLGIAVYDKSFAQWEDMLKCADDAVYAAKKAGKNSYQLGHISKD